LNLWFSVVSTTNFDDQIWVRLKKSLNYAYDHRALEIQPLDNFGQPSAEYRLLLLMQKRADDHHPLFGFIMLEKSNTTHVLYTEHGEYHLKLGAEL